MPDKNRLGRHDADQVGGAGIHRRVAEKFKGRTVKVIRAGANRGAHNRAPAASELGRRDAGDHAKLLDGFDWRKEDNAVDDGFVVINAVERKVVVLLAQSIHRQGG